MENKYGCPKSTKQDRDIRYRLEERQNKRKNDRNKILTKNRQLNTQDSNNDELNNLNGTYVVPENEKGKLNYWIVNKLTFIFFNLQVPIEKSY